MVSYSKEQQLKHTKLDKVYTQKLLRLHQECNTLWRQFVFLKANNICEYDDCFDSIVDPHHVITSRCDLLRYDVRNGVGLCRKHHTGCPYTSAHRAPNYFSRWFDQKFPERFETLWNSYCNVKNDKLSVERLEEIRVYLKEKIRSFAGGKTVFAHVTAPTLYKEFTA